jgi:gluconokinase
MEGVALQMHAVARRVQEITGEPRAVWATGGFSRSPLWRQILTDVFNREVLFPEGFESACRGAALVCLKALGEIDSLEEEAARAIRITHRHTPEPEAVKAYAELAPLFERHYERLEPEFEALSRFNLSR